MKQWLGIGHMVHKNHTKLIAKCAKKKERKKERNEEKKEKSKLICKAGNKN